MDEEIHLSLPGNRLMNIINNDKWKTLFLSDSAIYWRLKFRSIVPVDKSRGIRLKSRFRCGSNSVVECNLAKVEVAGSNPVSRSTPEACSMPQGGVAKW